MSEGQTLDASVVVVSFNTRDLLRECLKSLCQQQGTSFETLVVDNASRDGSADMVAAEFPRVRLIPSATNLGFAAANNAAFPLAQGRYVVLLNSDAFLEAGALADSVRLMDRNPRTGIAGGRLVGRDGSWQPAARMFPSVWNDFLALTGLASAFPRSRFFGRADRTWCDPLKNASVDWVPGAFLILRADALQRVGYFDEQFFLYYEEVDLCRRFRAAGYEVSYWPEIVVTHWGGESSKTMEHLSMSQTGAQLALWRMRAEFLYYRKHHGAKAWLAKQVESNWHRLRRWKNSGSADPARKRKCEDSTATIRLLAQAWRETEGGRVSPARPW
ncbi:MAG TPA: glycosyltransferase family 2 protein [Bryobacteraceae bacterium]|nr:glycosyltransferase family 2 protein [Bryobacteraceae bacterium]